jgi:O-acetylserine/cysteine efflux transporter
MSGGLPLRHALLALAVVAIWGSNFVVMKHALSQFSPLWLACLRFVFAALPLLLLPRPAVPWRLLAGYGLLIGVGQFGLLFIALQRDITPGLASLIVQSQVFFTLLLAWGLRGQRLRAMQGLALALAVAGIAWIGLNLDASATPLGLAMVLLAGLSWGCANLVNQAAGRVPMLAFVVWSSLPAAAALGLLAMWNEGPSALLQAVTQASWSGWAAVLWQAIGNTLFGYGVWGWLLARHEASQVVPLALLVPVFGMGTSAWVLQEALQDWKLQGAAMVFAGLLLNTWVSRRRAR